MTPLWSPEVEARVRAEARNLDPQERPAVVKMCTKCVVTNQRPRIQFDDEGVCSACRYAEAKANTIDWGARKDALSDLLAKHRSTSGYDVIVPASGGKDSAAVAWKLKHEWDMHPLCVKWAPFLYTEIGRANWERFGEQFDTIEIRPRQDHHRKLARLAFEYYGDPFQPFVYGQLNAPMHMAQRFGVQLVMFGENGEAEYGGDPSANDKPCWDKKDWDRVYTKSTTAGFLEALARELGAIGIDEEVLTFYHPPRYDLHLDIMPAEFNWWSYFERWHPQANYYLAAEKCGFEPNPERSQGTYSKYASLDDKLDGLHYFMAYVKFGIGRCTSDAAHEVRDGDISREEALALVARYDGEYPALHLLECLSYLSMDMDQLDRVIRRFAHGLNPEADDPYFGDSEI